MADSYAKTLTLNLKTLFDRKSTGQVEEWIDNVKQSVKEIKWIDENAFKQAANKIKADFNNLEIVKQGLIQGEDLERVRQAYQEQQENLAKIETLKKEIAEIEMFDKDNKILDELKRKLAELQKSDSEDEDEDGGSKKSSFSGGFKEGFKNWAAQHTPQQYGKKAFDKMTNSIEQFKDKALQTFKNFVTDALKELEEMASWDITGSTKYNKEASEMYMNYGLQGANAYAMNKALEATGIDNMETYLTDPLVQGNQALLNAFNEQYEIAKAQYEDDLEIAKEYQKFKKEFDIFKQELQKSLIDFFMDNKDTIMNILNFLMEAMQWLVDLVGSIVAFFGGDTIKDRSAEQRQSDMNELLGVSNNSTISYDNRSNNVNVSNTYNGVGKVDQAALQNVGQMTYQQIIEYLGRE